MNEQYHPIKVGTSGSKVHAGRLQGYVKKGYYSEPQPIYREICTRVNTKHINRPLGRAPLPAGTEITCEDCLREMAKVTA